MKHLFAACCVGLSLAVHGQATLPDFFASYQAVVDPFHKLDTIFHIATQVHCTITMHDTGRVIEKRILCDHSSNGTESCEEAETHRKIPVDIAPLPERAKGKNLIKYTLGMILFEGRLNDFVVQSVNDSLTVIEERVGPDVRNVLTFGSSSKRLLSKVNTSVHQGREYVNRILYLEYKRIDGILVAVSWNETNDLLSSTMEFEKLQFH